MQNSSTLLYICCNDNFYKIVSDMMKHSAICKDYGIKVIYIEIVLVEIRL